MLKPTSLCEHVNHGLAVEQNEFSFFWLNVCNQNESRLEKLWLKNIYCTTNVTNVDLHIPLLICILIFMSFSFQLTVHCSWNECIMHFHFQVLDLHELSLVELHCLLILRLFGCHVLTINLHPGKWTLQDSLRMILMLHLNVERACFSEYEFKTFFKWQMNSDLKTDFRQEVRWRH